MTSPFSLWFDLWSSAGKAATTGLRVAETAQASRKVLESRSRMIQAAIADPMRADHAELGRMVTEKVAAFGRAGVAATGDVLAIQASLQSNWSHAMSLMLSGRLPTAADANAMAARSSNAVTRSIAVAGKALAPVHRTATGNARRLKRSARKTR